MIIGVDGNEANVTEKVGVSFYTFKLLNFFQKQANDSLNFIVFLKRKPNLDFPSPTNFFRYEIVPWDFLWSQTFLPLYLYKKKALGEKIDVFFSPAHYAPRFCPIASVVTVHDLSYFYYPEEFLKKDLYQLKNWTKYSVKNAKKVIAVSATTKKDLIKFYQLPEEKIEVIYNGGPRHIKKLKLTKSKFILFVGTLQPRKNLITLIAAFNLFYKQNPEFKLVIAGKKGWLYENIFHHVKELRLEKQVIFTGYISEEELISYYKNAFCFVLPSFYEGFGIPLLEAMSFNCPVISSSSSSLPEVGGNACLYFNPKSVNDLLKKMKMIMENEKLRKELIKKGKERLKLFSWKTCAEKTLAVIKKTTTAT
jgi:glycosyltransferase involved in cell wall biosynthesis